MLKFKLAVTNGAPLRLLCLGAHSDDIEIGCGGTILKLVGSGRQMQVYWTVFSSDAERKKEALTSADMLLGPRVDREVIVHGFRDGFLPHHGIEIKELFEQMKLRFKPDLILTHYRHDLHQDHRLVSELTWNTFRDHCILEYEIPKYDGDLGAPNCFVALSEFEQQRKIDHILNSFPSQGEKTWFRRELFAALLRLRGLEANAASGYAEGFYCRKAKLTTEL